MTCPRCGSDRVYRSRYKSFGEFWRLLRLLRRPFRCHQCWARYGDHVWAISRGYKPRRQVE